MTIQTKIKAPLIQRRSVISAPIMMDTLKAHNVGPTTVTGPSVGFQSVSFEYKDEGGPNNLKPGYPVTMTSALTHPDGAHHAIITMCGSSFAYIDDNDNIDDHHLGVIEANLFFQDWNTIACTFYMRDNSDSEGVDCWINGVVLYYS